MYPFVLLHPFPLRSARVPLDQVHRLAPQGRPDDFPLLIIGPLIDPLRVLVAHELQATLKLPSFFQPGPRGRSPITAAIVTARTGAPGRRQSAVEHADWLPGGFGCPLGSGSPRPPPGSADWFRRNRPKTIVKPLSRTYPPQSGVALYLPRHQWVGARKAPML
jgi:hypothetical protein